MSEKSDTNDYRVPLATAIGQLRVQLAEAVKQAQKLGPEDIKFLVKKIQLELTVVAEDSVSGGGEVGWWIFKAKAEAAAKEGMTHKINLELDVGDVSVSDSQETA